jgi:hypothetical protein
MSAEPGRVPVAGSLSAKVIRACSVHKLCALTCPQRRVEDLGEVARFHVREPSPEPSWLERAQQLLRRVNPP